MVKTQLIKRGISDPRVLKAMAQVPREQFVPQPLQPLAYQDCPLNIGHGQTISQPYVVALACEKARLKGHENVLDIGTGSGYQAAVLSRLARQVTSLEIIKALAQEAKSRLKRLGYTQVSVIHANAHLGFPQNAPYHAIFSAAAASTVPPAWISQLTPKGILIMPQVRGRYQYLTRFQQTYHSLSPETILRVRYVPLINSLS